MHVTVSFDEWKLTERDIRSYVSSVLGALRPHWERLWQEAGESTSHPDVDQVDVFYDRAGGIMPNDTEWMVLTGAFKDAVTAFEVYLEKAAREVSRRTGLPLKDRPAWKELKAFYMSFGHDIEPSTVADIRELRHILTHQRGELRTKDLRAKFGAGQTFLDRIADDDEQQLETAMDQLADAVRAADQVMYPIVWPPR